jgi:hypothetical protein
MRARAFPRFRSPAAEDSLWAARTPKDAAKMLRVSARARAKHNFCHDMSVIADVFQRPSGALNLVASANMKSILITLAVLQLPADALVDTRRRRGTCTSSP